MREVERTWGGGTPGEEEATAFLLRGPGWTCHPGGALRSIPTPPQRGLHSHRLRALLEAEQ